MMVRAQWIVESTAATRLFHEIGIASGAVLARSACESRLEDLDAFGDVVDLPFRIVEFIAPRTAFLEMIGRAIDELGGAQILLVDFTGRHPQVRQLPVDALDPVLVKTGARLRPFPSCQTGHAIRLIGALLRPAPVLTPQRSPRVPDHGARSRRPDHAAQRRT